MSRVSMHLRGCLFTGQPFFFSAAWICHRCHSAYHELRSSLPRASLTNSISSAYDFRKLDLPQPGDAFPRHLNYGRPVPLAFNLDKMGPGRRRYGIQVEQSS